MTGRDLRAEIEQPAATTASLDTALAKVLQVSTYASIGLIVAGVVLLLVHGGSPLEGGPPLSLEGVLADLVALRPAGLLWPGIIGVIATPAIRVTWAAVGFWRRAERPMSAVSAGILVVIAIGVVVGVMAR